MRSAFSLAKDLRSQRNQFGIGQEKGRRGVSRRYYAGFSAAFAERVIDLAELPTVSTILDPWNGSGTTTAIASDRGYHSIGIDINPFANLVARARLANKGDLEYSQGLLSQLVGGIADSEVSSNDPMIGWLPAAAVAAFRALQARIALTLASHPTEGELEIQSDHLPPLAAFLHLALVNAARRLARLNPSSNPTWFRPAPSPNVSAEDIFQEWRQIVLAADWPSGSSSRPLRRIAEISLDDARSLPLDDKSVDLVLTSPPYCTRLDYVASHAFEFAAMGISTVNRQTLDLRRKMIGTPLVRDRATPFTLPPDLPASARNLLHRISQHPSKASSSYYAKTYAQYFTDMSRSLSEIARTLRPGGLAVLVLRNSYYKELAVNLPRLLRHIATSHGLRAAPSVRSPVYQYMTQINSRSNQYVSSRIYSDSILCMEKSQ